MSKATGSGKSETFKQLFKRVVGRPSNKKVVEMMLSHEEFEKYLETAQKHFGFTFTEESLDKFMTDWVKKSFDLKLDKEVNDDEIIDKMREYADYMLARLGMEQQDPDTFKAIDMMQDFMSNMEGMGEEITTEDGKKYKGYKFYDPENPIEVTGANKTDEKKKEWSDNIKNQLKHLETDENNVYHFKLMDYTKLFCMNAGAGMIAQFDHKSDIFRRRLDLIDTSKKYRFEDSFLPLLVHHNKNEYGYRRMPNDNMWIEVGLKIGGIFVSGVHIAKVYIDPATKDEFGSPSFRFYDDIVPSTYTKKGISVFVCGIEDERYNFYYHFILEETDIEKEKLKRRKVYSCPYCSMPMETLQDRMYYCKQKKCVQVFQKGSKTVYNMDDKKIAEQLRIFEMKAIWKAEDTIRQFATNLLDFLTNKRVQVVCNVSAHDMAKKNLKRAKRGKPALYPVNIIKVDGTLKEYVTYIKTQFKGNYKQARNETMVDGHFYRFKDKTHWSKMYSWIAKCKTDEEIVERLSKLVRRDPRTDMILPDEEQYEWDSHYKVIRYWKLPYYRFKGEGNPRERIDVIKTGVEK